MIKSNKLEGIFYEKSTIFPPKNCIFEALKKTSFKNTKVDYDPILNQYTLITEQECRNIENPEYGRRLGNIHYKEDS